MSDARILALARVAVGGLGNAAEFALEVSKGNVAYHSEVTRFGRNDDIGTATTPEDLWNGPTALYVPPTAARVHQIASTDTNDTDGGTGARSVVVLGLDENWDEISEIVTLDGTTNVATVNSYRRVNRMRVASAGSTGTNAGNITATADTDATVSAYISAGVGTTLVCHHSIPRNSRLFLTSADVNIWRRGQSSGQAEAVLVVREKLDTTPVLRYDKVKGLSIVGTSAPQIVRIPPKTIQGPADVFWRIVYVSNNSTAVSGAINGILVKDVVS